MKQKITITLQYDLAIGKLNLNEIVYRLKEVRDPLQENFSAIMLNAWTL